MNAPFASPIVAIVADEDDFRDAAMLYLQDGGFTVWGAGSAEAFYRLLVGRHADVVLADLSLPGESGLSLIAYLYEIGRHGLIAMSDQAGVGDRIASLEAGADQHFVKSGDFLDLAASVHAVLRRLTRIPQQSHRIPDPISRPWQVKHAPRQLVSPMGHVIELTSREMDLLDCLLAEPNCTVPKARILAALGGPDPDEDYHRVEVLLSRLRKKVEAESGLALPVRSVFGKGLVFVANGERRP